MKIKELPKIELPREKMEKYGPTKLEDFELLALLLGSGIEGLNVLQLSRKILAVIQKIGLNKVTFADLLNIKGLGKAKASQIMAVVELCARFNAGAKKEILSPQDIWNICVDIRCSKKEHFLVFYIDTQNNLIERQIVSIGILNASLIHPREIFEHAIKNNASTIIVAHNHPSGSVEPSDEDVLVTKHLAEAGKILGIDLIDHIIVSKDSHRSIKELGLF